MALGCKALQAGTYEHLPRVEAAPKQTDCLTAVRYLVEKTMGIQLDLDRIGNMPRKLVSPEWRWSVVKINSTEELLPGDLLFLRGKLSPRLITHVAMIANNNLIFHSSREKRGGALEELGELFGRYDPLTNMNQMLSYEDPRRPVILERSIRFKNPEAPEGDCSS